MGREPVARSQHTHTPSPGYFRQPRVPVARGFRPGRVSVPADRGRAEQDLQRLSPGRQDGELLRADGKRVPVISQVQARLPFGRVHRGPGVYQSPLANNQAELLAQVANGIFSCDASPVSGRVAFEGYPAGIAHLFTADNFGSQTQLTHDSDFVIIDSSRFACIANSSPVFSPDGSKLVYFRRSKCLVPGDPHENEYREDAFVMNSNGSNPVNLTAGVSDAHFSGFTWTFDGKWVLFRAGTDPTPDDVLAANMSGHAITGLAIPPVAMACSPDDSSLIYVAIDPEHRLYSMKLVWTNDTLYVGGAGMPLGGDAYAQRSYVDWVKYSKQ